MKIIIQLIFTSIALTACSSPALKQSIDTAETITIVNTASVGDFGYSLSRDDYDCYGFHPKEKNDRTVNLTEKPYVTINYQFIDIRSLPLVKSCKGTYTFKKNGSIRYIAEIGLADKRCSIIIYGQGKDLSRSATPIHLTRREFTQPAFDGHGPWCKANEEFLGSTDYVNARSSTQTK